MPKEAFGGDDTGGSAGPERKRPKLDHFGLTPDTNIRDLFWKIMASYAATKKPGEDLNALSGEKFTLMRMALSTLTNPASAQGGLSPKFLALYGLMMVLDGGWDDALVEMLEEGHEAKPEARKELSAALAKLVQQESYRSVLSGCFTTMLRGRDGSAIALHYIAAAECEALSRGLMRELVIFARGDVGESQMDAIKAISLIKEEPEAKKALIALLNHWDADARLAAIKVLGTMKDDKDVASAISSRRASESDERIKKCMERISP